MIKGKQLQYELWRECNNHCTYCTLGDDIKCTEERLKLKSMEVAISELKKLKKNEYSVIGLIGGEFFQGQLKPISVYNKFFELIEVINDLLNKEIIDEFWLNATMTIGDQKDLYDTINRIDNKQKLWILTSYDTIGRFHTKKMFDTWEANIFRIHNEYPDIKLNVTSILTGDFITKYLSGEFNITEFQNKYKCGLFIKSPVFPHQYKIEGKKKSKPFVNDNIGYFFPKRRDVLKFFMKYKQIEGETAYINLLSNDLRADEIRKNYNNDDQRNLHFIRSRNNIDEYVITDSGTIKRGSIGCIKGHQDIYCCYLDSDECILCDKESIGKL